MSLLEPSGTQICPQCQSSFSAAASNCPRCHRSAEQSGPSEAVTVVGNLPAGPEVTTMVGQNIGGYVLKEQIGHGGMGVVWRVEQVTPNREVAMKMIRGPVAVASEFRARFELEARALAVLDHPSILPLYEYGEEHGCAWFTMKLATGGSLSKRGQNYAGQWREIAGLLVKLATAIQYAHDRGVLHRDLKPANILFDGDGQPYIADFGLAKLMGEASVLDGSMAVLGTPAYLPPEIAMADARAATTASDIYGLGATMYELLTGVPPYRANSLHDLLVEITSTDPLQPGRQAALRKMNFRSMPKDLEIICMKCLARDPGRRYTSARVLGEDLERWLDGRPITARHATTAERVWAWARRNPTVASLSAALFAALLTGGILLFFKNRDLVAARDDAEQRIDFMTKDLAGKMQSFGQLTLLNEVFADADHYYAARPAAESDPAAMERRISFLLKFGEVLMPQGKLENALQKFDEAIRQAAAAAKRYPLDFRFRALQVAGHRWSGQALMDSSTDQRAREVLLRGIDLIPNPATSEEKAARAAILNVTARACTHLKDYATAARMTDESVDLCHSRLAQAITPGAYADLASAHEEMGVDLKEQADALKDFEPQQARELFRQSLAAFQQMLDACKNAGKMEVDNLIWQRRIGQAENWLASVERRQGNHAEARKHLAEQRAIMEPLLAAEPLNGEWQMSMVLNAWAEGQIAEDLGIRDETIHWHEQQALLSSRLMSQNPSVRMWWIHHQQVLWDLSHDLQESDPSRALDCLRRSSEAAVRANEFKANEQDLRAMTELLLKACMQTIKAGEMDRAISLVERVSARIQARLEQTDTPVPERWLAALILLQVQNEIVQEMAERPAAAAAIRTGVNQNWQKALAYPRVLDDLAKNVRVPIRDFLKRMVTEGKAEQALKTAQRWMELPKSLAGARVAIGWRAGWLRLTADFVEVFNKNLPDAIPSAQAFAKASMETLVSSTPSLALDPSEQEAVKRIEALLALP